MHYFHTKKSKKILVSGSPDPTPLEPAVPRLDAFGIATLSPTQKSCIHPWQL